MNFDYENIPASASGVDALYYFIETNIFYDEFYQKILSQIQDKKDKFESMNYEYHDNDLVVNILDHELIYTGIGRDGFLYFKYTYFRLGMKESSKNPTMKNIKIQLNAVGIYKVGVELINGYLFGSVSTGYHPITRIDLNTFIQYDFSYLTKEMVVSKKKNHSATLVEKMSGYELETYYVGKPPFQVRIYNKRKEMKSKASDMKLDVMNEYFAKHYFEDDKPIFNVEFEIHREFLKEYGIDTVEDALKRAETLFRHACDLIRIVDPTSITESELKSANRNRAKTQRIWSFIKLNYSLEHFLQDQAPLSKIEKSAGRYSLDDGEKSIKRTLMRLFMNDSSPTFSYILGVYQNTKEAYELKKDISFVPEISKKERFIESLKYYSDHGLEKLLEKLAKESGYLSDDEDTDFTIANDHYDWVYEVMVNRGIAPDF